MNEKHSEAQRAKFEAWTASLAGWKLLLRRRPNGDYYYEATRLAWAAWCAAVE